MRKLLTFLCFLVLFKPMHADIFTSEALQELLSLLDVPHQQDAKSIVDATQMRFLQTGKERWEYAPLEEDKKTQLIPLFKQIGLWDEIRAGQQKYDSALIFGGFYTRVCQRLSFLVEEFERGVRFQQIVFLTGQRFLDRNTEEKDLPITINTETEMMLYAWEHLPMPQELREIPLIVIDTPRQQTKRPTTRDTLISWLNESIDPGHCLFVSSQPFCGYQNAVARNCLPSSAKIETIGPKNSDDLSVAVYLDNLARWLYEEYQGSSE